MPSALRTLRAARSAHHQTTAWTTIRRQVVARLPAIVAARSTAARPLHPARAHAPATLCVGPGAGCLPTLQAAIDAAGDGDTIRLGPGRFAGGVTITRSLTLIGAGACRSIIVGGGPVVTIGAFAAAREPTVVIVGVAITGGRTTSGPESVPFVGQDGVFATGGGVEVPPSANPDQLLPGATVTA